MTSEKTSKETPLVIDSGQDKKEHAKSVLLSWIERANKRLETFEAKNENIKLTDSEILSIVKGDISKVKAKILKRVFPELPEDIRYPYVNHINNELNSLASEINSRLSYNNFGYVNNYKRSKCIEVKKGKIIYSQTADKYLESVFRMELITPQMKEAYQKAEKVTQLIPEIMELSGLDSIAHIFEFDFVYQTIEVIKGNFDENETY